MRGLSERTGPGTPPACAGACGAGARGRIVDALAAHLDLAGGDRLQGQESHAQCGLARARLADDAQGFASAQLQRRIAHRMKLRLPEPALRHREAHPDLPACTSTGASSATGCTTRCGRLASNFFV
jgi:hypothetical protein